MRGEILVGHFDGGVPLYRIRTPKRSELPPRDHAGFRIGIVDEAWFRFRPQDGLAMPDGVLRRDTHSDLDLDRLERACLAVARAIDFDQGRQQLIPSPADPAHSIRVVSNKLFGSTLMVPSGRIRWPVAAPDEWLRWTDQPFRWPTSRVYHEFMQHVGSCGPDQPWVAVHMPRQLVEKDLIQIEAGTRVLPSTEVVVGIRQTDQPSSLGDPSPHEWYVRNSLRPNSHHFTGPTVAQAVRTWFREQAIMPQSQLGQWWADRWVDLDLEPNIQVLNEAYLLLGLGTPLLWPYERLEEELSSP